MTEQHRDDNFERLLDFLKSARGLDLTGYKRATLTRRVRHRMNTVQVANYADYMEYLEHHADEYIHLFNTILINVTSFFRDPEVWDYMRAEIVPHLLAGKKPHEPIRVWSAACASGEEAYSLAMVLAEALGVDGLRERVKIYATDVDEEALTKARQGSYTQREVNGVPPHLLERYFDHIGERYLIPKEVRRTVIFGRHDLVQDAPISHIDLLTCRNCLMYFNPDTQAKILARLYFALNDGGFMLLGKAEMLMNNSNIFAPVDIKHRAFMKVRRGNLRERLLTIAQNGREEITSDLSPKARIQESAFEADPYAQLILDASGQVALANERCRSWFGLTPRDVGRRIQDLEISYRPVELRSLVERAYAERRPITVPDIQWTLASLEVKWLDIQVVPLFDAGGAILGAKVLYNDMTAVRRLSEEVNEARHELETAYEELQSINEELETTNEELQSSIEELQTTNEELQSTNEELETMNEELQSTNEELETMNDEMRQRTIEMDQLNSYLESILANLRMGVIILDLDMGIQLWNSYSEELWGLRTDEVLGKNFMNLDIGLPVEALRSLIRGRLVESGAASEAAFGAINRRGQTIQVRVKCTPLRTGLLGQVRGAILLVEDIPRRSGEAAGAGPDLLPDGK